MKLYYLGKALILGFGSMMIPYTAMLEEQLNPKGLFKTRKEAQGVAEACELTLAKNLTPYETYCFDDVWDIFEVDSEELELQPNGFYKVVKK